jgi:hypothetical protein
VKPPCFDAHWEVLFGANSTDFRMRRPYWGRNSSTPSFAIVCAPQLVALEVWWQN